MEAQNPSPTFFLTTVLSAEKFLTLRRDSVRSWWSPLKDVNTEHYYSPPDKLLLPMQLSRGDYTLLLSNLSSIDSCDDLNCYWSFSFALWTLLLEQFWLNSYVQGVFEPYCSHFIESLITFLDSLECGMDSQRRYRL